MVTKKKMSMADEELKGNGRKHYVKKVKKGPNYVLASKKEVKSSPRNYQKSVGNRTLSGYRKV